MSDPVVVLDNGGGFIKVGMAGSPKPARTFPNCTARSKSDRQSLIGDMLLDAKDILSLTLRRPFERGYLTNIDVQREIWARTFKHVLKVNPKDCGLVLTDPLFNFGSISADVEELVFEVFKFKSMLLVPAAELSIRADSDARPSMPTSRARAGVIVDAGFSFTTVVPVFDGKVILKAVRRIDFGGKAMTNHFKELVSYRSLHLMDETYLVESIKDLLCFVSSDVQADLKLAKARGWDSPYRREFVLPDGVNNLRGYLRDKPVDPAVGKQHGKGSHGPQVKEQVLVVNNERFMVPEVLFHPSDIRLNQAGLAETIVQAVDSTHPSLQPLLYSNIILTGGVCKCPGFKDRLIQELQPMVLDHLELGITIPEDPQTGAWIGGSLLGKSKDFSKYAMTRAQYMDARTSKRISDR